MVACSRGSILDRKRYRLTGIQVHRPGRSISYAEETIGHGADTCEVKSPNSDIANGECIAARDINSLATKIPGRGVQAKDGSSGRLAHTHIVQIQINVSTGGCRFSVEADELGANVSAEVYLLIFALGGNTVIHIFRADVVPLSEYLSTDHGGVIRDQDNESVILLLIWINRITSTIGSESHIKIQLVTRRRDSDGRSNQPVLGAVTIDVDPGRRVTRFPSKVGSSIPSVCTGRKNICGIQALITSPFFRWEGGISEAFQPGESTDGGIIAFTADDYICSGTCIIGDGEGGTVSTNLCGGILDGEGCGFICSQSHRESGSISHSKEAICSGADTGNAESSDSIIHHGEGLAACGIDYQAAKVISRRVDCKDRGCRGMPHPEVVNTEIVRIPSGYTMDTYPVVACGSRGDASNNLLIISVNDSSLSHDGIGHISDGSSSSIVEAYGGIGFNIRILPGPDFHIVGLSTLQGELTHHPNIAFPAYCGVERAVAGSTVVAGIGRICSPIVVIIPQYLCPALHLRTIRLPGFKAFHKGVSSDLCMAHAEDTQHQSQEQYKW